jgi:hypothetical protein
MSDIKLFDGTIVPATINTKERIFQVVTYDGETILCNLLTAHRLITNQLCKGIKHYWNHKFTTIGKSEVLSMPLS